MNERRELVGELLHYCFGLDLEVRNVTLNGGVYFKLTLTRLSERVTLTSKKILGAFYFRTSITTSLEYGVLCPVCKKVVGYHAWENESTGMKCQKLGPKEILCRHLVKTKVGERNDYILTDTRLCFGE